MRVEAIERATASFAGAAEGAVAPERLADGLGVERRKLVELRVRRERLAEANDRGAFSCAVGRSRAVFRACQLQERRASSAPLALAAHTALLVDALAYVLEVAQRARIVALLLLDLRLEARNELLLLIEAAPVESQL